MSVKGEKIKIKKLKSRMIIIDNHEMQHVQLAHEYFAVRQGHEVRSRRNLVDDGF